MYELMQAIQKQAQGIEDEDEEEEKEEDKK